jgi:hypothetical protein
MASWIEQSKQSILPLSANKNDFSSALREWRYTNEMMESETSDECCQLCQHPHIRYQFLIINSLTHAHLWVGSECIKKFQISARIDGQDFTSEQTKKMIDSDRRKLIQNSAKKRVINALIELSVKDESIAEQLENLISYYDEKRCAFTPHQLSLLVWKLNANKVNHNPADFKMIINRNREKQQLKAMEKWKRDRLIPYLSISQKNWIEINC